METAKVFENGRSQAVCLPKKFRFGDDEVYMQNLDKAVLLVPENALRQANMVIYVLCYGKKELPWEQWRCLSLPMPNQAIWFQRPTMCACLKGYRG